MLTTTARSVPAVAFLAAVTLATTACGEPRTTTELAGATMGTAYRVVVESESPPDDTTALGALVEGELTRLERLMSTYDPASDVSRFSAYDGTDPFAVDSSLVSAVLTGLEIARRSGGAFDPTVAALVDAWGFGPGDDPPPDSAVVASLLRHVGYSRLSVDSAAGTLSKSDPDVRIDLSGIAKGYAADLVAERLREQGYESALVDVGGELHALGRHLDGRPWRVAVEGPGAVAPELLGTINLVDEAIATSGDFRNFYEHDGVLYAHIIDPRTGFPVRFRGFSVSVVHRDGAMADAWATALSVLGPDAGFALAEREGLAAVFAARGSEGVATRSTSAMGERLRLERAP
ncbi:MAG: FAD:protein FMN transferase [Gemmatimonadota bacterium]|jgi:thiamine biosynthesis lipoprotein